MPAAPDAGVDAYVPPPPITLGEGLAVSEIALYQTVKISVAKDGAAVVPYNAPLITGRKGLARVFMSLVNKKYKARFLTAELHIVPQAGPEIVRMDSETLSASSEADLMTTFNFTYDENALGFGATLYVVIRDPKTMDPPIRFPQADPLPLTITKNPGRVRARIVPIRYMADMSGRLPDVSMGQMDRVRTELMDLYPTNEIDLDVRDPIDGTISVDAQGMGWPELLQTVVDTRAMDAPPSDIYYVGWFEPRASFGQYCQGGCIIGLATTADPAVPAERAVLAVGYSGDSSASTVAHELGHTMGRHHAPCGGAQGIDPQFPYPDGSTGVPGWRQSDATFMFDGSDIMGYCAPFWISDYTYKALAARITSVNAFGYGITQTQHDVQRILVAPNGSLSMGRALRMSEIIGGNDVTVAYLDVSGKTLATAHGLRYGYDHVPGGFVLVMDPPKLAFASVALR
jgi:hypothetical protein